MLLIIQLLAHSIRRFLGEDNNNTIVAGFMDLGKATVSDTGGVAGADESNPDCLI